MNDRRLDPILSEYGVIYFGNDLFSENRTSSHHIARRLSGVLPVLWIDSPGMRKPHATKRDFRRILRKLGAALRRPTRVSETLWHATVPQIPFRSLPGVEAINRAFGLWAVRRAVRHAGFRKRISWFVAPHTGYMAHRLGEDLCVHYCTDNHSAHPGMDVERMARAERDIAQRADVMFVAPPALLEAKKAINPETHFAPHGVDADMFATAMDEATQVPAPAAALPHPVVGYFGTVGAWIDTDLIASMARARPQYSFLLVGQSFVDPGALATLPNVLLAGVQPYATLPAWAKAFDVAIIPYRQTEQIKAANPLKLREYLATGRPVVTTYNPEIEKFADVVRIARDDEEFLRHVDAAIAQGTVAGREGRLAAVREGTWDRRFADVLATVTDALRRKQGR